MQPFKGCLRNLKHGSAFHPVAEQVGVSKGCPEQSLVRSFPDIHIVAGPHQVLTEERFCLSGGPESRVQPPELPVGRPQRPRPGQRCHRIPGIQEHAEPGSPPAGQAAGGDQSLLGKVVTPDRHQYWALKGVWFFSASG